MFSGPYTIVEPPEFIDQVAYYFGAERFHVWDTMREQIDLNVANAAYALRGAISVAPGIVVKLDCDPSTRRVTYKELV